MKESKEVIITSESSGELWSAAIWDPVTGTMLRQYKNTAPLGSNCLQLLRDSYLLAADASKPHLHIWQVNSQMPLMNVRLTTPGKVSALTCTSGGTYLAASINEKIFIWQLSTGKLLRIIGNHYQTVTCLKFSFDSSILASGGEDGLVFLWPLTRIISNSHDRATNPLHGFSDHTLAVQDLNFGGYGASSRLITVSLDRTARIYDSNCGIQLLILVFDAPLTSVCFDMGEHNIYIGFSNGDIRQFNLRIPPRQKEYHVTKNNYGGVSFKGHTSSISKLSVSSDCGKLLSASSDGRISIWDITSCQVMKTIQHRGPITNAIFVPAYANFNADTLESNVTIKPLRRVCNEPGSNTVLGIISGNNNNNNNNNHNKELLKFQDFFNIEGDDVKKSNETRVEIEKLKKINAQMYKYGVQCLLKKI